MGHEAIVGEPSALEERAVTHLRALQPSIKDADVIENIMPRTREVIKNLHQTDATLFLTNNLANAKRITPHLGPENIARHGLTFGLQTDEDKNLLVRLYLPAGIKSETSKQLASTLNTRFRSLTPSRWGKDYSARISGKPDRDTKYFSSAEILVRSLAHLLTEDDLLLHQPLPTVLFDRETQPVGYTLEFDQLPSRSRNAEAQITDTLFDLEDTLGLDDSSGDVALELYDALKRVNSLPYAESRDDLKNMMILDENGEFITFNRIGYSTSRIHA